MIKLNPFARVEHNDFAIPIVKWRALPRLFWHLAHVALGLPAFAATHAGAPHWAVAATATLCAIVVKCIWIRYRVRRVTWTGFSVNDWPDFWSDLGLTLLGAFSPPLRYSLPLYYALSTFNGT